MSMTAEDVFGSPRMVAVTPPVAAAPPTRDTDPGDPHDKSDRGPFGWFDDPTFWLVVIAALATGVLGVRFKWWATGAEASARVNVGDEISTLVGTTLYAITGIVIFKVLASKINIPGLQKVAAAI